LGGGWIRGPRNPGGTVQNTYVFFGGQRIARRDSAGAIHYYFSDHLGTHGVVENATGTTCEQDIDYYPYGGVEEDYCSGSGVTQNYEFNGKERDTESNLDNFGARYFTSNIGRFMTPDWSAQPAGVPYGQLGDPQSLNLYAYVRNNPLSRRDPNGHAPCTVDGEHHGNVWCWLHSHGHLLGVSTQKEQADDARANLSKLRGLTYHGRPVSLWAKTATNQELIAAQRELVHDLSDEMYWGPFSQSGGIGQAAGMLTQWGWTGQQAYNDAKNLLNEVNTPQGTVDRRDLLGKVPSEDEAVRMIEDSGGNVDRIEAGHAPGGDSTHTNPHINYTTASGVKGTIDIQQ
jgi:RHS repeat-associated protein